jgi:enoyl-CoA hydratase/carnithine racemase
MVSYRTEGALAWATIDRPEKLNAMTAGFWGELADVLARAQADPAIAVLLLSGAGPCFSVGGDFAALGSARDLTTRRLFVSDALATLRAVDSFTKPTIAALHGHALGAGCELSMVCDIVVADETLRIGLPEAQVGLLPSLGTVRGGAHVNLHRMKHMTLTGKVLDADEARVAGLVNRVTEPGEHATLAREIAATISRRAPLALQIGKRFLNRAAQTAYGYGVEAGALMANSADHEEGVAAFNERRQPRFQWD